MSLATLVIFRSVRQRQFSFIQKTYAMKRILLVLFMSLLCIFSYAGTVNKAGVVTLQTEAYAVYEGNFKESDLSLQINRPYYVSVMMELKKGDVVILSNFLSDSAFVAKGDDSLGSPDGPVAFCVAGLSKELLRILAKKYDTGEYVDQNMLTLGDDKDEHYIGESIVISNTNCAAAVQAPQDMAIVITARTTAETEDFSFSVERIGSIKDLRLRTTSCSSPDDVSAWCQSGAIKKDMSDTQKKIVLARGVECVATDTYGVEHSFFCNPSSWTINGGLATFRPNFRRRADAEMGASFPTSSLYAPLTSDAPESIDVRLYNQTSIKSVASPSLSVSVEGNSIVVDDGQECDVYNLGGICVGRTVAGRLSVEPGVYVVRGAGGSAKVTVAP